MQNHVELELHDGRKVFIDPAKVVFVLESDTKGETTIGLEGQHRLAVIGTATSILPKIVGAGR